MSQFTLADLIATRRQLQLALKSTMGNFQATQHHPAWITRHRSVAGDYQHAFIDDDLKFVWLDSRQRYHDQDGILSLEDVDRRFPTRTARSWLCRREKLPLQLLRTLEHLDRVLPHERVRIS